MPDSGTAEARVLTLPTTPTHEMQTPSSRDVLRADQRRRLLNAMATVIARDGFHGARIQDVAREARVSLRTFYAEFENKEQCFMALHLELTSAVIEHVTKTLDFEQPWKDVMRQGFQTYYDALAAVPRMTRAVSLELATLSDDARLQRDQVMGRFAEMLVDLVDRGRELHPEIPSQPLSMMMARGIIGGVTELIDSAVVRNEIVSTTELIDTSTEMLWRLVTHVEPSAEQSSHAPKSGESGIVPGDDADVRR
jgi:AcrR family transcriptional regulator